MSKPTANSFATIEPTELAAVAGGRRASSSRSTASDDQLLDTISSIETSIKDLGKAQAPTNNAMSQIMPLVALSMMQQQPAAPQVIHICKKKRC